MWIDTWVGSEKSRPHGSLNPLHRAFLLSFWRIILLAWILHPGLVYLGSSHV